MESNNISSFKNQNFDSVTFSCLTVKYVSDLNENLKTHFFQDMAQMICIRLLSSSESQQDFENKVKFTEFI